MSRSGPLQWRPQRDKQILAAIERQASLHEDWRESQREAQAAVEAIASAQAASDDARSDALAAGTDDPGALDTSELEAATAAAAERRDLLGAAFGKARAAALALADERAETWEREAKRALDRAGGAAIGALDNLKAALADWQALRAEVMLARSEHLRQRGRPVGGTVTVEALPGRNGEPTPLPTILAALRTVTEAPAPGDEPVEPEPAPLTAAERRAIVASGGEIYGPGRG